MRMPAEEKRENHEEEKAAGRGLHALRRSPEGWCLRIFHLVVKNQQARISYNDHIVAIFCTERKEDF